MSRPSSSYPALRSHHLLDHGMAAGHHVRVLADPHDAWVSLLEDIAAAQVSILIELYILVDDAAGEQFVAALVAAHARGVDVRLVLDGLGCMDVAGTLPGKLTAAGVRWRAFHPVARATPWRYWTRRNHRKIVVLDERIAHVSGRNVGSDYYAMTPDQSTWLDLGVRVEGPEVAQMAAFLRSGWRRVRRVIEPAPFAPSPTLVTTAFSMGRVRRAYATRRILQAVRLSQKSIHLVQAYFLPHWSMQRALVSAARRGVDVRVVVPDVPTTDVPMVALASEHGVGRLLRRGVRVFMLRHGKLHGKFVVVDGHWWTVGSANLDPLSLQRNLEANVVGLGVEEAGQVVAVFERILADCTELTWESWRQRPWWRRLAGALLWRLRGLA